MTATKVKDVFEKDATLYLDSNTLDGAEHLQVGPKLTIPGR
jgi:hypothetical protein